MQIFEGYICKLMKVSIKQKTSEIEIHRDENVNRPLISVLNYESDICYFYNFTD